MNTRTVRSIPWGTIVTVASLLFSAGGLYVRLGYIERKLDSFVAKEVHDLEHVRVWEAIRAARADDGKPVTK